MKEKLLIIFIVLPLLAISLVAAAFQNPILVILISGFLIIEAFSKYVDEPEPKEKPLPEPKPEPEEFVFKLPDPPRPVPSKPEPRKTGKLTGFAKIIAQGQYEKEQKKAERERKLEKARRTLSKHDCKESDLGYRSVSYPGGYTAYLRSDEWKAVKRAVLVRDNYQCTECSSVDNLQIHHLNYNNIFFEEYNNYEDLVTLCQFHHFKKHNKG